MSREIVMGTAHKYNWVQLGAGINHPEVGRCIDASEVISKELNIPDASVKLYPFNGYGDPGIIRYLLMAEKPHAILHFTDPRYWIWLYHMEAEIREALPIMFYHVWDDLPPPKYNENFYRSCDFITCISRQTYNIVRNVWQKEPKPAKWQLQYNPHGVDDKIFHRITDEEELKAVAAWKKRLFKDDEVTFSVLYNNRNIRRKMTGDVIMAFQKFIQGLPKKEADKCRLVFHTQPVDDNGTDLYAVLRDVAPDVKYVFTDCKVPPQELNVIYNVCDAVVNIASNEGFGLSNLEAMMAERLTVTNVTGGLQDQMGFKDEKGNLLHEDVHYGAKWGSNHDGKYKTHGEWVLPIFPNNLSLNGSPPTPYIFDDRCDWREVAVQFREAYDMSLEERIRRGQLARQYCLDTGMTTKGMCQRFIDGIDTTFKNWKPRPRFGVYKA